MSKAPEAWHGRLDPLDVVYCRFPDEGRLSPAPKPRPALVLNVNDESVPQRVEVAYGTSQRTRNKYAGEFELAPRDGPVFKKAGLTEETKFHLGRTVWLPYNDRWFMPPPAVPARGHTESGDARSARQPRDRTPLCRRREGCGGTGQRAIQRRRRENFRVAPRHAKR